MRYIGSGILILLLVGLVVSETISFSWSKDGRLGTSCLKSDHEEFNELCEVSIYQLLSIPEKYDGKVVSVSGFLDFRVYGRMMVSPVLLGEERLTEDSSQQIVIHLGEYDAAILEAHSRKWITVIGVFEAIPSDPWKHSFSGELKTIYEVYSLNEIESAHSIWSECVRAIQDERQYKCE